VPTPFDFPMLAWLNQPYDSLEGYAALFNGAVPEIMGESPYLNARDAGIAFALTKKNAVQAIFLYAGGIEDFAGYQGALPAGLSFACSRTEVRSAMGTEPAFSGEAGGSGIFAIEHSFDRFEDAAFYVRFEYKAGDDGVRLVTMGVV
jgi:hypothetical protein